MKLLSLEYKNQRLRQALLSLPSNFNSYTGWLISLRPIVTVARHFLRKKWSGEISIFCNLFLINVKQNYYQRLELSSGINNNGILSQNHRFERNGRMPISHSLNVAK